MSPCPHARDTKKVMNGILSFCRWVFGVHGVFYAQSTPQSGRWIFTGNIWSYLQLHLRKQNHVAELSQADLKGFQSPVRAFNHFHADQTNPSVLEVFEAKACQFKKKKTHLSTFWQFTDPRVHSAWWTRNGKGFWINRKVTPSLSVATKRSSDFSYGLRR